MCTEAYIIASQATKYFVISSVHKVCSTKLKTNQMSCCIVVVGVGCCIVVVGACCCIVVVGVGLVEAGVPSSSIEQRSMGKS